ncbi:phage portal protein, partial [Streptomyces klenkii]|uniref:phage portal protein n=1 Tax=Streptomyces klenkii TaxID=1420899 RepID=UPI0018F72ABD
IEQQSLGYVIYSLTPWLTRLERTAQRLLAAPDLYLKFNTGGLLRGDLATRYAAYAIGRQWGFKSPNDIRAEEDEPPIPGGDDYLVPLNMVPAGSAAPPAQRTRPAPVRRAEETESPSLETLAAWVTRHYEAISDYFEAQGAEVLAALELRPEASAQELIDAASANEELAAILFRLASGLAEQVGQSTAVELGGAFAASETVSYLAAGAASTAANVNATTINDLGTAIGIAQAPAEVREAVRDMFGQMTAARARVLAQARVSTVANFAAHEGAKHAGARTKTWRVWDPNPRASHAAANGQTVGIREDFDVGGRRGRWPHDHRLGVDEIAGCTCRLQFNL